MLLLIKEIKCSKLIIFKSKCIYHNYITTCSLSAMNSGADQQQLNGDERCKSKSSSLSYPNSSLYVFAGADCGALVFCTPLIWINHFFI